MEKIEKFKEIQVIKRSQLETIKPKTQVAEIKKKTSLDMLNCKMDMTENRIRELED